MKFTDLFLSPPILPHSFPILSPVSDRSLYTVGVHGACCFCIVIQCCSTKMIKKQWEPSQNVLLKRNGFSTKGVCIPPWSLQNGSAYPHGLYVNVHVLFFFLRDLKIGEPLVTLMMMMMMMMMLMVIMMMVFNYVLWSLSVFTQKVSCFWTEVSTQWVCMLYVLFLHCCSMLFH